MKTQEKIKTPLTLRNEIEYKKDDVEAKEILANDNGSVTLLAFDNDATIARHSVGSDVLVTVIEGAVEFEIEDSRYKLTHGDAVIMPANTPHSVTALEKAKVLLTRIKA